VSSPWIYDLAFDDENEGKLATRGISPEDVLDILSQPHVLVRNKRRRRGLYKMIGKDSSGRMLTIIIEPTTIKSTWRPVTGWESSRAEIRQFLGSGG